MKKEPVGGQAVIEGVMMQSKRKRAVAVRKANGEITIKKNDIKSWIKDKNIDRIPFLRGSFILIESICFNFFNISIALSEKFFTYSFALSIPNNVT